MEVVPLYARGIELMQRIPLPIIIVCVLAFVFVFPRLLLSRWGPNDPWLNYFYQYGFGLIVFVIGLWVVLGSGSLKPGRGRESRWLKILVAGFVVYASVHALWIVLAVGLPFKGLD